MDGDEDLRPRPHRHRHQTRLIPGVLAVVSDLAPKLARQFQRILSNLMDNAAATMQVTEERSPI
jgi:hypothetical protein